MPRNSVSLRTDTVRISMLLLLKSDEELIVDMTGEVDPSEFDIVDSNLDGTPDKIGELKAMETSEVVAKVSLLQKLKNTVR